MGTTNRAALKAATEQVSALAKQIKSLEAAEERAAASVEEAETETETQAFAQLDSEIAAWRVAQLKKGASTKTLPAELKARLDAKRATADELEQARSAQVALSEELDQLRVTFKEAENARVDAATDVLHQMGLQLGKELAKVNRRRAELIEILRGLSFVAVPNVNGRPTQIGIPTEAHDAIHFPFEFAWPPRADPMTEVAVRWTRRLDALCADPEASITVPKHLEPEDYIPGHAQAWEGPGHAFLPPTPGSWRPEEE